MHTLVIVVLYGKEDFSSDTFLSLQRISADFTSTSLYLFNNGPLSMDFENSIFVRELKSKFKEVLFREDVCNRPLSLIYNEVIGLYNFDRYIIFDDDSSIGENFFSDIDGNYLKNCDVDLQLPIIVSKDTEESCYPRINAVPMLELRSINENEDVYSIGSGLVIYRSLVDKFSKFKLDLFDRHFAFYGVDYSLFYRIRDLKAKGGGVSIEVASLLRHALSGALPLKQKWRAEERLYDRILTLKYYEKRWFIRSLKIMKMGFYYFNKGMGRSFLKGLNVYFKGHHPRCDKYSIL